MCVWGGGCGCGCVDVWVWVWVCIQCSWAAISPSNVVYVMFEFCVVNLVSLFQHIIPFSHFSFIVPLSLPLSHLPHSLSLPPPPPSPSLLPLPLSLPPPPPLSSTAASMPPTPAAHTPSVMSLLHWPPPRPHRGPLWRHAHPQQC